MSVNMVKEAQYFCFSHMNNAQYENLSEHNKYF